MSPNELITLLDNMMTRFMVDKSSYPDVLISYIYEIGSLDLVSTTRSNL